MKYILAFFFVKGDKIFVQQRGEFVGPFVTEYRRDPTVFQLAQTASNGEIELRHDARFQIVGHLECKWDGQPAKVSAFSFSDNFDQRDCYSVPVQETESSDVLLQAFLQGKFNNSFWDTAPKESPSEVLCAN